MPRDDFPPDPRNRVGQLDDGLVLPQIPHDALRGKRRRQNMLHLSVPRDGQNVFRRLRLCARRHGGVGVVHVPDEYFRVAGAGREQILLERVEIERVDGAGMLAGMRHQTILALQQFGDVVDFYYALVAAAHDGAVFACTVTAPHDFVISGSQRR